MFTQNFLVILILIFSEKYIQQNHFLLCINTAHELLVKLLGIQENNMEGAGELLEVGTCLPELSVEI